MIYSEIHLFQVIKIKKTVIAIKKTEDYHTEINNFQKAIINIDLVVETIVNALEKDSLQKKRLKLLLKD